MPPISLATPILSDDEKRFRALLKDGIRLRHPDIPGMSSLIDFLFARAAAEGFQVLRFRPPGVAPPRHAPVLVRHDGGLDRGWLVGDGWALALAAEYILTGVTAWALTSGEDTG